MRGAPHYHILLWIENVPVVGIDCPEEVCSFIQERITCHIPDSNTSPDLHYMVRKYQMHKYSKYCERKILKLVILMYLDVDSIFLDQ